MSDRSADMLDRRIKEISDHLDRLKAVRQFMSEDPAMITEITGLLLRPEANGKVSVPTPAGSSDKTHGAHVIKITTFLKTKPADEWVAVRVIAEATGVKKSLVYDVLMRTHTELFEVDQPSPKRKYWRLKRETDSPPQQ